MHELVVSAVAVFADIHESPKILIARRNSGPNIGQYTLPGGKEEDGESPYGAGKRELWQETGLTLLSNTRLNRLRKPIQFILNGQEIRFNLFYTWIGKSIRDEHMLEWTERKKMDSWHFRSLSWLRDTTEAGFFPSSVFDAVLKVAKRTGEPWVGNMTLFEYDFPHAGLHSPRSLRKTISRRE